MQISSEMKNIRRVSSEIIKFVRKSKASVKKDTLFDIKLCIEEAVRNAIVHGNKSNKELPVDISHNIKDNTLILSIEDRGDGFDVSSLPNPTDEKNLLKESGRGVYIIYRLMDKVDYNAKGNCITMEKNLI